jgi:hypothetical protein
MTGQEKVLFGCAREWVQAHCVLEASWVEGLLALELKQPPPPLRAPFLTSPLMSVSSRPGSWASNPGT